MSLLGNKDGPRDPIEEAQRQENMRNARMILKQLDGAEKAGIVKRNNEFRESGLNVFDPPDLEKGCTVIIDGLEYPNTSSIRMEQPCGKVMLYDFWGEKFFEKTPRELKTFEVKNEA